MALTADEKARLKTVLETANGNENNIREGIIKALKDVTARETRNYLWRTLEREAKKQMRAAKKRAEAGTRPRLVLTA